MTKDKITRGSGDVFKDIGISEAQAILTLIRKSSRDDSHACAEINRRVYKYILNGEIPQAFYNWRGLQRKGKEVTVDDWLRYKDVPNYMRSRDALKFIRPKGWAQIIAISDDGKHSGCEIRKNPKAFFSYDYSLYGELATPTYGEEPAELDVIIQALEYEREKNDEQSNSGL